jgi:hypothetical protein
MGVQTPHVQSGGAGPTHRRARDAGAMRGDGVQAWTGNGTAAMKAEFLRVTRDMEFHIRE